MSITNRDTKADSTIDFLADTAIEHDRLNALDKKTRVMANIGEAVKIPLSVAPGWAGAGWVKTAPAQNGQYTVNAKGANEFISDLKKYKKVSFKETLRQLNEAEGDPSSATGMTLEQLKQTALKVTNARIDALLDWYENTFPESVFSVIHSTKALAPNRGH